MKKIILIFVFILLVVNSVIAGFGGGQPGTAGAAASGAVAGISEAISPIKGQEKIILGEGEFTTFEIFGKTHTLRVIKINPSNILISIMPTGIVQKINIYATRRFDLNRNGLEDLLVKFQDYSMNKVIIYYAFVAEEAIEKQIEEKKEAEKPEIEEKFEEIKEKDYNNLIYTIIVILIIALIAYSWYKFKKNK